MYYVLFYKLHSKKLELLILQLHGESLPLLFATITLLVTKSLTIDPSLSTNIIVAEINENDRHVTSPE